MTNQEIKAIVMGTTLIYTPTNTAFKVSGYNERLRDTGVMERVTGIESNGMEALYPLSDCVVCVDSSIEIDYYPSEC